MIKKAITKALPEFLKRPVRRFLAPHRLRSSWLERRVRSDENHLEIYWNSAAKPNRQFLITILAKELEAHEGNETISVLEYGSHVGVNLKLLSERIGQAPQISYFAVEPNVEAVNFMKENLGFVSVLNAEDEAFCATTAFPPTHVVASFVNSVFYSMEPKRVQAVLEKLARISDFIVIGESMENLDGATSRLRSHPECFEHPYRKWLAELGFDICSVMAAPDPVPQLTGYIVCHRKVD